MGELPGWYVLALPDTDAARRIVEQVGTNGTVIRQSSGRPWLITNYPADQVVEAGGIAVIGYSDATQDQLMRTTNVDELASRLAGSYIIASTMDGKVSMRGSAFGVRRVYAAKVGTCHVLADRADVLAEIGGFTIDPVALAIRTLRSHPDLFAEVSLWHNVSAVEPGRVATLRADGCTFTTRGWWRRPDPILSRAEGALRLCAALDAAVETRTRRGTVYADLSGGFDSTPTAWFASRSKATLITGTGYNDDPGGREDLYWSRIALESMPGVENITMHTDSMPQFYGGLSEITARLDTPCDAYRAAPRMVRIMRGAVDRGASVYLNGIGGDDLLTGMPKYERGLLRHRPLLALYRLNEYRLLERMTFREVFGPLTDRRSYRRWLLDTLAAAKERDELAKPKLTMDWDQTFHWPKWYGKELRAAVIDRMCSEIGDAEPLGPDVASHGELVGIRSSARIVRGTEQLGAELGIACQTPLTDDRVIEAALAVRREDRFHPKEVKPLMREAMRGRLSDAFLQRSRKGHGAPQSFRGIRDNRAELIDLCTESPLVELGVLDRESFVRHAFPNGRWPRVRDIDTTINGALFTRNQLRDYALA